MSTILIGVDESTRSEDAVAFGRRLAGAATGRVVLACAFPYSDVPSRAANLIYRHALKDDATATVERMQRLLGLPDARIDTMVVANPSAARALHTLAETERAAIVVVGHTHSHRAGRLVPGATAERLLHGAPCPVAVAPEDYRLHAPETIRRIGVAYTETPESLAALAAGASIAHALHARLDVIGVVSDELYDTPPIVAGPRPDELRADAARHVQARLDEIVAGLQADLPAEAVRLDGDPAEQLAAHSAELDLLIMGSRGYGPLHAVLAGGVSGRVTREARCPVIVVPRGVAAPLGALFEAPAAANA